MRLAPLGAALLALACSCDRALRPPEHAVYAAWEEGLTLVYEDPALAPGQRLEQRQQVRVKRSEPAGPALVVTKTFTSLTGQGETRVIQRDGGVLLETGPESGILLLPEGFPDRVDRWESRGIFNRVVGRASVRLPGVRLPEPAVGVWVESTGPAARTRTLYLPDIGEAETLTWIQGRWVTTNLLVSRGFTDVPTTSGGKS